MFLVKFSLFELKDQVPSFTSKDQKLKNTTAFGLKITKDNSVREMKEIIDNDLNIDTLLKLSDTERVTNVRSHKYVFASPLGTGSGTKDDNSESPYIVDVRFLNKILI